MKKAQFPSHIKTLAKELGCSPCEAQQRVADLQLAAAQHDIQVTYVTRHRQWWLSGFTSKGPDFGIMKC
jgi:hypothetical protein